MQWDVILYKLLADLLFCIKNSFFVYIRQVLTAQIFFAVLSCSRLNLHAPQRCHPADIEAMYPTANGEQASGGRVRVGVCSATAHSSGYPCYVSPSTLNRLRQIGVSSTGLCSSMTARDCKTVRVTNTEGLPFCVLTMIGTSTILPGGRTILQFNFNNLDDSDSDTSSPRAMNRTGIGASEKLRCLQVCACFRLSERAIFGKTRKATKEQVFDAQYARVDEDTDTLSLSLILPMDAPCTLSTDLVEISTFCQLEMTVAKSAGGELKIEVMKLEVPCGVVHTKIYSEQHGVNFGTGNQSALSANIPFHSDANDENGSADMDLLNDITMLAIRMMEECGEA